MPTYEYRCEKCNHEFESVLPIGKMNQPIDSPCPSCGEINSVRTRITSSRFAFRKEFGNDSGFSDTIKEIKKKHPLHNIQKDY